MPRTKSAKKALRQNIRRRSRNVSRKNRMKGVIKDFRQALAAKDQAKAREILPKLYKTLDKLAKVGFVKPNKAARLKSRFSRKLATGK
ncbi:MAG TPA: 30S ribosomal protein S20 [Candidatus Paceibacterota bacterium]|nr:30S ribosomal protein S20 [Candidatus Paceibacterota bacterium]